MTTAWRMPNPHHPVRITVALILTGIGATRPLPFEVLLLAAALFLLWEL